jgi:hypothetical protein
MYSDEKIGVLKAVRGKKHDYLAMILDFTESKVLTVDMTDYVKGICTDFDELEIEPRLTPTKYPWDADLFKVKGSSPLLQKKKAEVFYTYTMKSLFVAKRARQDIAPAVAFLSTRVKAPTEQDWFKLKKMLRFLKATLNDKPRFEVDNMKNIYWHLDASFAVHHDMKSHTGATMTLGKGTITSISTKQKINTRSSTEAELVSIDDIVAKAVWIKSFLDEQGYGVKENLIYRDNTSSMKLEVNGRESAGKRTRHFNIKYFYITDLIKRQEVSTKYCQTDYMIADYMTKPTMGKKFEGFRQDIMNLKPTTSDESGQ